MRHWPVWNEVFSCQYSDASSPGNKSYGVKETGEVTVKFGTSKANSEVLVRHTVTVRQSPCGKYTVYRFGYCLPDEHGRNGEWQCVAKRYMRNKDRQIMPPGFDPFHYDMDSADRPATTVQTGKKEAAA